MNQLVIRIRNNIYALETVELSSLTVAIVLFMGLVWLLPGDHLLADDTNLTVSIVHGTISLQVLTRELALSDYLVNKEAVPNITNEGCPPGGNVNRDGWALSYETTSSDGLRVYDAYYNGHLILKSTKLVEWHEDYGSSGYRRSIGCNPHPYYPPIYPYGDTAVNDLLNGGNMIGFEVVQDFRTTNWGSSCYPRFEQHIQFYADGRFRISSLSYGKGCGANYLNRPIVRIDLAIEGNEHDQYALWDGEIWVNQNIEFYRTPYAAYPWYPPGGNGPYHYDVNGAVARVFDTQSGNGFYVIPDEGQFGTNSQGDEPFMYVVQHKPSEGDTDIPYPFFECCFDNHHQGPHLFVNGEAIDDQNIVLWYVPQMQTDTTPGNYYCWTVTTSEYYPCWGGPMFVPFTIHTVSLPLLLQE